LALGGHTVDSSNYRCLTFRRVTHQSRCRLYGLQERFTLLVYRSPAAFTGTAFRSIGLIQAERSMIGDAKNHEWNLLKEQFAKLVRAGAVRADDAEVLLDVEFQRRLAEVIEQVLKRRRGFIHRFR
jgi:hypothetical protein